MARITETSAVAARRRAILEFVIDHGSAQADDLVKRFGISRMTVHRDLEALTANGLIRRVHGGVTTLSDGRMETSVVHRARHAMREKRAIAAAAARLIRPGEIVVLDDSTTTGLLTDHFLRLGELTVITNSLGAANRLAAGPEINLIGLGGQYEPRFDAYFGNLCEASLGMLRANTLLMSVSAIHGITAFHQEQQVIKAKLAMMEIVERRILMVDSQKFDVSALNRLARLDAFDLVITDDGIAHDVRARLEDSGIRLQIAANGETGDHNERAMTLDTNIEGD